MTMTTSTTATSDESGPSRLVIIDRIVIAVTGNRWNDLLEKETLCDRSPGKISSFLRANSVAQFSGALFWNEDAAESSSTELARTLVTCNRPHGDQWQEKKPQNPQFLGNIPSSKRVTDRRIGSLFIKIAIKQVVTKQIKDPKEIWKTSPICPLNKISNL